MPIFGVFTPFETRRFKIAIEYMELNYRDNCSAEQLAVESGINVKLLRAGILSITGLTIHRYIIQVRIKKATDDLADFEKSIKWIAYKNGFGSSTHFSREFKKLTGQTPSEYRFALLNVNGPLICK